MNNSTKAFASVCQMTSTSDKEKNFQVVCKLVKESKQRNVSVGFFDFSILFSIVFFKFTHLQVKINKILFHYLDCFFA